MSPGGRVKLRYSAELAYLSRVHLKLPLRLGVSMIRKMNLPRSIWRCHTSSERFSAVESPQPASPSSWAQAFPAQQQNLISRFRIRISINFELLDPTRDPGAQIALIFGNIFFCKNVRWQLKINFLCSHKFHKIAHYFSFDVLKKKIWANFQRIIELFTQKIVNKL